MKKVIAIAALAALCACADNDRADEEAVAEQTAPAAVETVASESWAGTYEFEMDGVPTVATLNPDGTYTDTQNGEVTEGGTWVDRDGKVCFDPEGDPPEMCWTSTEPDAQGTFTTTADDGTTLTVRRTS